MCFETDPDHWRDVNEDGLQLLSLLDLKRYHNEFPNKENRQDKWDAAVTNPSKYVNLLVRQCDIKNLRAETDKENYYNSLLWDQKTKIFSWPTIKSRHKRIGLHQGLMKWSTVRSSR